MVFELFDQIFQTIITVFFPYKPNILLITFRKTVFLNASKYTVLNSAWFSTQTELSNDWVNHPSKQTPSFSTSGVLEMAVWPAATTCGDSCCDLDTCQQETENHMEHKTAVVCNDLILTYNKELGHVCLFL